MNTLTSLLLLFFIGLSIAAPVIYELDGSFEDASFKRGAPVQEEEVTGWDVTGDFEVTGSSTSGDWTDDNDGTTGDGEDDDGQIDGGFTTTGEVAPATSGSGNSVSTTGKAPSATTGKIPPAATSGVRVTTGAVTEPGKKVVLLIGMIVDESTYTEEGFQKGINKIMELPEDEKSIVITGTSKRSITVNFYFIIAGAEAKTQALLTLVENDDPALQRADFTIFGATASEAIVDEEEQPTTGGMLVPEPSTTEGGAQEDDKGLSDGAIAGIVIGVIILVVVVVGVAMFMLMRKKHKTTRVIPA